MGGINILYLAYLGESKKIDFDENARKLLIVRRPVNGIPAGFIHVHQLSPSIALFKKTRKDWKQGIFSDDEKEYLISLDNLINEKSWWHLYKREFINEMNTRQDMKQALNRLKTLLNKDIPIYLFCYCKDVCRCHRCLIGEYFESNGYQVDFRYKYKEEPLLNPEIQLSLFDME